jgi:uncharacterized membrane protein
MLLFRGKESNPRSLVKAISWRTLGSIDTFLLGLFFTHDVKAAGAIASTEVVTKIALYYFHERAWAQFGWGLPALPPTEPPVAASPTIEARP